MEEWTKRTIGQCVREVALRNASKDCMVFKEARVSYGELDRWSDELALGLMRMGVKKGDNVSVLLPNCPEWVYCFIALAKIGAVTVPVNLRFRTYELEYQLSQSESRWLIMVDKVHEANYLYMFGQICPEVFNEDSSHFQCRRLSQLRSVILLGDSAASGAVRFDHLRDHERGFNVKELKEVDAALDPDDLILIQYTSGTTSFPKGAMLSHNNILQDAYFFVKRMGLRDEDRIFGPLPFYHVGGTVLTMLASIVRGLTFFSMDYFDPQEALDLIQREKCTVSIALFANYTKMQEHPNFTEYDISSLRTGVSGGSPEIMTRVRNMGIKGICNFYGLSETSPNVTITDPEEPFEIRRVKTGKPHPGVEVKITDVVTGEDLAAGDVGEICVRGWNVMKGYYNKPEETAKTIDSEGWLHTGDLGSIDSEGYLAFTGRIKNMVKVGGENVSLEEVEDFLLRHPKVQQVEVIGVPDRKLDEVCMAFVQIKENQDCTEQEIFNFCHGQIARFKIPRYVRFVKEFPMTGSGKVQKFELRRRALQELGMEEDLNQRNE
jgi:fatty-acyl-CoA synthase